MESEQMTECHYRFIITSSFFFLETIDNNEFNYLSLAKGIATGTIHQDSFRYL